MIESIVKLTLAITVVLGGLFWICWLTDSTPYFDRGPDVCAGGIDGGCIRPIVCRYVGIEGWKRLVVGEVEDCPTIKMIHWGQASDAVPASEPTAPPPSKPSRPARHAGRKHRRDKIACRSAGATPASEVYGPKDDRPWIVKPVPLLPCPVAAG